MHVVPHLLFVSFAGYVSRAAPAQFSSAVSEHRAAAAGFVDAIPAAGDLQAAGDKYKAHGTTYPPAEDAAAYCARM